MAAEPAPILVRVPNWRPWPRRIAIVLWCGFLGACLLLLALLIGWEAFAAVEEPGLGLLASAFAVGWSITALTAVMALSLSGAPRRQIRSKLPEDA